MKRDFTNKVTIPQLTGDASPSDVISGKTFYSNNYNLKQTGELSSVAAVDTAKGVGSDTDGVLVQMTNGAHVTNAESGNPEVRVPFNQFGNVAAGDVKKGSTFTSSAGFKVAGTLPNIGDSVYQLSSTNTAKVHLGPGTAVMSDVYSTESKSVVNKYLCLLNNANRYFPANSYFAILASKLGTAKTDEVVSGKTFTSTAGLAVQGTLPARSNGATATSLGKNSTGVFAKFQYGYWPKQGSDVTTSYIYFTEAQIGNATRDQVLSGAKFTSSNGVALTGTMANNGSISKTVAPGDSYTIPKGYHTGSGKVTAGRETGNWFFNFVNGNSTKIVKTSGASRCNYALHKWTDRQNQNIKVEASNGGASWTTLFDTNSASTDFMWNNPKTGYWSISNYDRLRITCTVTSGSVYQDFCIALAFGGSSAGTL